MEIPDVLKSLTIEKHDFIKLLLQDEPKGVIVVRVAFLDFLLGQVLSVYFCGPSRRPDFVETIVSRLGFDAKISTLKKLSLDMPHATLRDSIITAIRPMQELRNKAAHASSLKTSEIDNLYSDKSKRDILADFPKAFEAAASQIQTWLHQLEQATGFSLDA